LQAAERLLAYAWPGNVRELQNSMERAVALTRFEKITVEDLPDPVRSYQNLNGSVDTGVSTKEDELLSLEEIERRHILRVLAATGGNKTQAAHILGVDRRTLHRKFGRNGSDRPDEQQ
jgi:two-component system response regulator HydG